MSTATSPHLLEVADGEALTCAGVETADPSTLFPHGVKVVVFDVVGTLVEPSPSVAEAYERAAQSHGVPVVAKQLSPRFSDAWERQEAIDAANCPPHATSRSREWHRWRDIVFDVFVGFAESHTSEKIFADLWDHFARPTAWQPTTRGPAILAAARGAGLEVALASNFDERLFEVAATVSPLTQAAHVFASSDLGWRKPARGFFREVESRLGRQPEELMMIGDNAQLDVTAARAAGWHAALLPTMRG